MRIWIVWKLNPKIKTFSQSSNFVANFPNYREKLMNILLNLEQIYHFQHKVTYNLTPKLQMSQDLLYPLWPEFPARYSRDSPNCPYLLFLTIRNRLFLTSFWIFFENKYNISFYPPLAARTIVQQAPKDWIILTSLIKAHNLMILVSPEDFQLLAQQILPSDIFFFFINCKKWDWTTLEFRSEYLSSHSDGLQVLKKLWCEPVFFSKTHKSMKIASKFTFLSQQNG